MTEHMIFSKPGVSEFFDKRPQVNLLRPGAPVLLVQLPVRLRNCVWLHESALLHVWHNALHAGRLNDPINDDVSHMDALQDLVYLSACSFVDAKCCLTGQHLQHYASGAPCIFAWRLTG